MKKDIVSNDQESNLVDETQTEQKDVVSYTSYSKALSQLKQHQTKARELEAKLNEYQAHEEQRERERLEAEKKYQELYQKERQEKEQLSNQLHQTRKEFIDTRKLAALNSKVGGVKKSEYWSFANLEAIEISEDGRIVEESLEAEAQRFRSNYSDLLKPAQAPSLPAHAPKETVEEKPKSTREVLSRML